MEDLVDKSIIDNKNNIELVNNFSKEFFSTNNAIAEKVNAMFANIDKMIEEEKKKEMILNVLESKINSIELGNTLKELVENRSVLFDKYNTLNNLLLTNNKKIEVISNIIRDNKQIIDGVYKIISNLDDNINSINTTIMTRQ